jgi:hypothetical protein
MFAVFTKLADSVFSAQMRNYATEYANPSKHFQPFLCLSSRPNRYNHAQETYMETAKALKEATGPYKASRDAYVAATATYTKALYE